MPGQHSDEERERKERIKKLKAKTSKMRLAVAYVKSNPKSYTKKDSDFEEHITKKYKHPANQVQSTRARNYDEKGSSEQTGPASGNIPSETPTLKKKFPR